MTKLLFTVVMALLVSLSFGEKDLEIQDIFDNDSEFMRGFETGLFLRTKGGTVEEYGCSVSDNSN